MAIAWWSDAESTDDDALTSNFNLYVWSPSGGLPGYSASWDNNYEIAEFIAPETGIYTIGAYNIHR